jgi:hypothetical protein
MKKTLIGALLLVSAQLCTAQSTTTVYYNNFPTQADSTAEVAPEPKKESKFENWLNSRSDRERRQVLTYEWNKNTPIGIHYGWYDNKIRGFIQFDTNDEIFTAIRRKCRYGNHPEINISLGWTVKLAEPFWLYFGPGVTVKNYYGYWESGANVDKEKPAIDNYDTNNAFAISPVAGIMFKYSYLAIRATYQYRWATKDDWEDYIGKSRLSLGVGFTF